MFFAAVDKNAFIVRFSRTLHRQDYLEPFVRKRPQGFMVAMPGISIPLVELGGPTAEAPRLVGKKMQRPSGEFPASAAEVNGFGAGLLFSAGEGDRSGSHQSSGLGDAGESFGVATDARQQGRGQYISCSGKRSCPLGLRQVVHLIVDLVVHAFNFTVQYLNARCQKNDHFVSENHEETPEMYQSRCRRKAPETPEPRHHEKSQWQFQSIPRNNIKIPPL